MRQLENEEREAVLAYVGKEPEMNLFIIGDVENYGVKSDVVCIYVQEDETAEWEFLILKFYDNYILYSTREVYNAETVAEFFKGRTVDCISGKEEIISQLVPYFPQWTVQSTYMSRCNRVQNKVDMPEGLTIRELGEEDVEEAIDFYLLIEEFAKTYQGKRDKSIQQNKEELKQGGKTIIGGYVEGKLAAIAETSADNSMSAMVVGVATHPDKRGKGYASAVVSRLCQGAFEEGKQFLCLFYDNPVAGRIYNRIGFEELGKYAMFR